MKKFNRKEFFEQVIDIMIKGYTPRATAKKLGLSYAAFAKRIQYCGTTLRAIQAAVNANFNKAEVLELLCDFKEKEIQQEFNIDETHKLVVAWAQRLNLIQGATPQSQMLKMTEEVGELAHAIARGKLAEAKDAIGDCMVVLTILSEQLGMTLPECYAAAYDEIKDRTGRMENGIFIREQN